MDSIEINRVMDEIYALWPRANFSERLIDLWRKKLGPYPYAKVMWAIEEHRVNCKYAEPSLQGIYDLVSNSATTDAIAPNPKLIDSRFNTVAQQAKHIGKKINSDDLPFCYLLHVAWEAKRSGTDRLRAVFNFWTDVQRFLACSLDQADHWADRLAVRLAGDDGQPIPWRNHKSYGEMVMIFSRPDHGVEKPLTKERAEEIRRLAQGCGMPAEPDEPPAPEESTPLVT